MVFLSIIVYWPCCYFHIQFLRVQWHVLVKSLKFIDLSISQFNECYRIYIEIQPNPSLNNQFIYIQVFFYVSVRACVFVLCLGLVLCPRVSLWVCITKFVSLGVCECGWDCLGVSMYVCICLGLSRCVGVRVSICVYHCGQYNEQGCTPLT